MSFIYKDVVTLQEELRAGNITCRQVVEYYLQRNEAEKHLNAFLEIFAESARERADMLDARLQSGAVPGKLFGMVIGVKDVICIKGQKVTASSRILDDFTSLYNATAIERLLEADAIIIGRCNCDEFAMGSSNENSAFGPVLNYLDNTRVPGGSSGGSVAAVQAGLCMASLGSETGGSIRQPASFCGVLGMKPTYGRISRYGLLAFASSFDQIGPITNTVEDMALLMEVMAGPDPHDSTSEKQEPQEYSKAPEIQGPLRIAYYPQTIDNPKIDPEISKAIKDTIASLQAEGHTVEPVDLQYLDYLVPTYYVLTTAEASSNLSRYAGIHYGYRDMEAENMENVVKRSRSKGFGNEVKRRIMLGTFVLSSGYYDAYYTHAQKVRRIIRDDTVRTLEKYDLILLPTTPTTAFTLGEKTKDPIEMYLADIFTVQANITGLPAISVPLFRHSNGMPFGLQFMADYNREDLLLSVTRHMLKNY
ncbi:MAG: Asp-tRNA(Asn)/Glu-tRNA(Gln) amidotransferase subunit GatA [Chitinophagales bacterium]